MSVPTKGSRWYEVVKPQAKATTTKVMLYDDIGAFGIRAKDFVSELDAITTPNIDLHINSYGGEIVDGLACYNAIRRHRANVTVHIDGLAASVASVVACAGDTVRVAKNAFLMMHNGWGMAIGDPAEMRKSADILDKLCNSIAEVYSAKTLKSVDECRQAMDEETWFSATEAKAWGLVDQIEDEGEENDMAASVLLAVAKYQKAPPALRKFAAKLEAKRNEELRKEPVMEKVVLRDGKWFVGDAEVDASAVLASVTPPPPAVEPEKLVAQARAEGEKAGRKAEAEYRAMFTTVVAAAKLDPTAAVEFEKTFYGRAEADLKFLASHAIGQRAKPLGEGAPGNGEGEQAPDAEKADQTLVKTATERFSANLELRKMFGLGSYAQADDPAYQAALKRYMARERQWAKDQQANGSGVAVGK